MLSNFCTFPCIANGRVGFLNLDLTFFSLLLLHFFVLGKRPFSSIKYKLQNFIICLFFARLGALKYFMYNSWCYCLSPLHYKEKNPLSSEATEVPQKDLDWLPLVTCPSLDQILWPVEPVLTDQVWVSCPVPKLEVMVNTTHIL